MDIRQNTNSMYPDRCFISHLTYTDDDHLHSHQYFEIAYILNGRIEHICNDEQVSLQEGDLILLRPGDLHTYKRFNDTVDCIHRDICISQDLFKSVCDFLDHNLFNFITQQNQCIYATLAENQLTYFESNWNFINNHFGNVQISNSDKTMISLRAALASIISIIYSNQSSLDSTSSYPIWLKNLLSRFTKRDFIQGGIAYIIKDIPYSQAHICRIFKKFIGETITDHLNTIRLNWAKTFLENSSTSISSIAEEIGFTSESYFIKLFKKKFNLSPAQYRLRHKNALPPPE